MLSVPSDAEDNIKKFFPKAQLTFERNSEIVKAIKCLWRPVEERWAWEKIGWVGQYRIERPIEDFIKELE